MPSKTRLPLIVLFGLIVISLATRALGDELPQARNSKSHIMVNKPPITTSAHLGKERSGDAVFAGRDGTNTQEGGYEHFRGLEPGEIYEGVGIGVVNIRTGEYIGVNVPVGRREGTESLPGAASTARQVQAIDASRFEDQNSLVQTAPIFGSPGSLSSSQPLQASTAIAPSDADRGNAPSPAGGVYPSLDNGALNPGTGGDWQAIPF